MQSKRPERCSPSRWARLTAILVTMLTLPTSVLASELDVDVAASPEACKIGHIDLSRAYQPFRNPPETDTRIDERHKTVHIDLRVDYARNNIAGCPTWLRSYNGRLIGPTVRIRPGWTFEATIHNKLPKYDPRVHQLLEGRPEATKKEMREIRKIFEGHDSGESTPEGYVYEPPKSAKMRALMDAQDPNEPHGFNVTNLHTHGWHVSPLPPGDDVFVAVQPGARPYEMKVRLPDDHVAGTAWYHAHKHGSTALQVSSGMVGTLIVEGGLDDIPSIARAREKILVFEQVAYDEKGMIEGPESYQNLNGDGFQKLQRPTLINGQVYPVVEALPGEVQYWRMVHGGLARPIIPQIQKFDTGGKNCADIQCDDPALPLYEIALDGIPTGTILPLGKAELYPGYRVDALVQFPADAKPGDEYFLVSVATDNHDQMKRNVLLAKIVIGEGTPEATKLPSPERVAKVKASYPQFDEIKDSELTGEPQTSRFVLEKTGWKCPTNGGRCEQCSSGEECNEPQYMIDNGDYLFSFNPDPKYVRTLKLGTASEWTLSAKQGSHPYHIHVNPFEWEREVTLMSGETLRQKVWKDTLVTGSTPVKIRARYTFFTGAFVMHCHVLNHEDQGMMQVVEIVP